MKKIFDHSSDVVSHTGEWLLISCDKARRNPGRAYMPDMAYSSAYETYASDREIVKSMRRSLYRHAGRRNYCPW